MPVHLGQIFIEVSQEFNFIDGEVMRLEGYEVGTYAGVALITPYKAFEINYGNNIVVGPSRIYACIAPVGGHTCLTAGERSEPAD